MEAKTASRRPDVGAALELTVDSLAHGGAGVARHEGYVVFVPGAVPGDRVRAVVAKRRRAFAEARLEEVVSPGPDRVAPVADHPGVPWQVLRYEAQLATKSAQVADALRRIGRLEGFDLEPIVPAGERWRYRNKLEYSFGTDPEGRLVCGFHAPGRWDVVEPVDDCLLASERGNDVRRRVVEWCRNHALAAHDRRAGTGVLRNLVVREGRRTGQIQARLVTAGGELDARALAGVLDVDGLLHTVTDEVAETTASGDTVLVSGTALLEEVVGELRFLISPGAFFQTNTEMAERLYAVAAQYAALEGWERVFDLYCGIGTIGLHLAARTGELWGLEVSDEAVADAERNARANDVTNARFLAGDVRRELRGLVEAAGRPDVVVVDPPRAGLSQKVVRRIVEAGPRRIVYLSCNPTTLAPNAAQLVEAGWALRRVRPVDMFPQTPHIECVAQLERD
jgi:23S rRNA (uracil1939-C5)-methyltransferase